MSATGPDVFDKTVQTTNVRLEEINSRIGPDRRVAWHVLGAVLHTLRDRLPIGLTTHLGAQSRCWCAASTTTGGIRGRNP